MKLVALVLAMLLVGCSLVLAEETSQANWNKDLGGFGNSLREKTSGHFHDYIDNDTIYQDDDDRNVEFGPGVNLILFEKDKTIVAPEGEKKAITVAKKLIPDVVTSENKYDFGNKEYKTYLVATYNIWEIFKKKPVEQPVE